MERSMGMEYKLQFEFPNAESVTTVLRRLPMVREAQRTTLDFEFRVAENSGSMPDALARIEQDGLYFCDFGGMGRQFLGILVARLVSEFGPVTVADFE
jgi:hypothetical protein